MSLLFAYHGALTIEALRACGVASGWHCLEVGAGGGDITRWLAEEVAPNGRVVAVDLETRWLEPLAGDLVDVRRGDFSDMELGSGTFDLAVAQMLLLHLPDPQIACRRFVDLVGPNGQIVIHDADFRPVALADATPDEAAGVAVMSDVMRAAGLDLELGPKLASMLEAAGAAVTHVEERPCDTVEDERLAKEVTAITIERFRNRADAPTGAIDAAIAALTDDERRFTGPTRWVAHARVNSRSGV